LAHVGEHAGAWQVPVQTPEAHWVPIVQPVPSGQLGEQPPPPEHFPLLQCPDEQSPVPPQAAPVPQVGEHVGVAHLPAVHTPDPQS
jgi:hypothetical protein